MNQPTNTIMSRAAEIMVKAEELKRLLDTPALTTSEVLNQMVSVINWKPKHHAKNA